MRKIEYVRRPVLHAVQEAACCGHDDEISVPYGHLDDTIYEIESLRRLTRDVLDTMQFPPR